jgi:hypothetical protein
VGVGRRTACNLITPFRGRTSGNYPSLEPLAHKQALLLPLAEREGPGRRELGSLLVRSQVRSCLAWGLLSIDIDYRFRPLMTCWHRNRINGRRLGTARPFPLWRLHSAGSRCPSINVRPLAVAVVTPGDTGQFGRGQRSSGQSGPRACSPAPDHRPGRRPRRCSQPSSLVQSTVLNAT